jgi:outer membrane protein insertion porin family
MRKFIPIILLVTICSSFSAGQETDHGYEVGALRFEGNKELGYDQLLNVIRTRETPWAIWKWIYTLMNKEILGGQKPEYFDPYIFASDYQQIKRFYEDNGFFHARVDTSIIVHPDRDKVFLTFSIEEGPRSLIDTVVYKGLENLSPEVQTDVESNKQVKAGVPYIQSRVEAEYNRIVGLCANNGYVNIKLLNLNAWRYASTDNFSIVYNFNLGKRYTFGNISVQQDTVSQQYIDSTVVLDHLDFSAGDYYGEEKKIESERNLNRLGIFEATKVENTIPNNSSEITQIPVRVLVRTRPFQEASPEVGINDENNAFNVLIGAGYSHRNFLGGARNISTNLRLNIQPLQIGKIFEVNALKDSSLISKVEWTTQFIQPYFINNKTSFNAAFSAILDKQSTYYIPSLSIRLGTLSQTATYTKLFIDWNLQLSDPKTLGPQQDSTDFFERLGFRTQFNSFVTLTLQRDKRNDIFYPSEGIFQSISVEEGGLIPRAFGGLLGLNLPYAQYVKFLLTGQWYWNPDNKRDLIWALRLRSGAALMYGESPLPDIPLSQRFFSGGSGSVRGWRARGLGIVPNTERGGDALIEGNIEARWNLLNNAGTLGFIDLQKISLVFFCDFGNIWTEPQKMRLDEVAMAFGLGIRYNTIAGPIRFDFGMKMYDPSDGSWVTDKRFFPETVYSQGILQIGFGHTF